MAFVAGILHANTAKATSPFAVGDIDGPESEELPEIKPGTLFSPCSSGKRGTGGVGVF